MEPADDKTSAENVEVEALGINLKKLAREVIELMPELPAAATELVESITHPGHLADLIAANVDVPIEEKQAVLETVDFKARMKLVLELLNRKREILKLSNKIDSAVKGEMSKTQREYYLRQQLKAIKEELGEMGEEEEELDELQERLKKAGLPPDVEEVATKELNRLKTIPAASSEYTVARTYLDWIADLPWQAPARTTSTSRTRATMLDADHYGIQKVKKRILEYLAVLKLKHDMKGPILCLVGPARRRQDLARPVDRQARRAASSCASPSAACATRPRSAGTGAPTSARSRPHHPEHEEGRHEEPGHDARRDRQARRGLPRRPGGRAARGARPGAEQHVPDHYLDVPFDLSKVLFIATANQLDPIPGAAARPHGGHRALRLHAEEKLQIAQQLPRPQAARGARARPSDAHHDRRRGAAQIIDQLHARGRRAQARARDRGRVPRGGGARSRPGKTDKQIITVRPRLKEILGPDAVLPEVAERTEVPGVATGLAWTPVGGDILFIEATQMPGKGG